MKHKRSDGEIASEGSIVDVPGIRVGHAQDKRARTGCTVILCGPDGAVAGVDVRGAAPGTRETDLLAPGNLVERVHAIVLTGGSVFGLDSACGVVSYLEEQGVGYDTGVAKVPIVPAAVIFDLGVGNSRTRPDAPMGYRACDRASSRRVEEGQIGAGTGATVGKIAGYSNASPGGVGTASIKLKGGVTVGVLVVVNAFGDVVDHHSDGILSGARFPKENDWLDTTKTILGVESNRSKIVKPPFQGVENTTIAAVATDALLTKAQAQRVAMMAHDGMARAIRPAHTMYDGDTIFTLSTGTAVCDVTTLGVAAAELLATAIARVGKLRQT